MSQLCDAKMCQDSMAKDPKCKGSKKGHLQLFLLA